MVHRHALSVPRLVCCLTAAAAWTFIARPAVADVSSWLYVGAGPSFLTELDFDQSQTSLEIATGLGSSPSDSIVFGGVARTHTHFGHGTDIALLARVASHGYVVGDFGAALDLGGYQRFWGPGATGALGSLSLGAPYGLTTSLSFGLDDREDRFFAATLGIDLARLTVYRLSGRSYWHNPFPATER